MGLRHASTPFRCLGFAAVLLTGGLARPAEAQGLSPGFVCGVMAPMAEVSAVQRIAARRRAAPRRQAVAQTPMLRAFFSCPAEPSAPVGVGWRTSGPKRAA